MDLSTRYLGLTLPHPLMVGASPLAQDLDGARRLEDAGAAAITLHSLFEEQIVQERMALLRAAEEPAESFGEALSYLPPMEHFALGPEAYLEHIRRVKAAVALPVIASLNGITETGWTDIARLMAEAGADALELNIYFVAAGAEDSAASVEDRLVEIARRVKTSVGIPVAVKLSPFFSALRHVVQRLDALGIDGLVLFNRFYQPDIDIERLETVPALALSTPAELRLRLRWLAVLSGQVRPSLAVSGGVHAASDAIKAVMAGAHGVQVVSALLRNGPAHLTRLRDDLAHWLEAHGYDSLAQMRGSMNLQHCPDPAAFERANYMQVLQSWSPEHRPVEPD